VLAAGIAGGVLLWQADNDRPRLIRGSSTEEFEPAEKRQAAPADRPWPTYAYDAARTHVAPGYRVHPPFRRLWTLRTGNYVEFPPSVGYGRVFIAQLKGRFWSVDARTGKIYWRRFFPAYCTMASPTVGDTVVYQPFVSQPCDYGDRGKGGFVVAMRVSGGRIRWRAPIATESSILLVRGILYLGSWDHHVYALDAHTGRVRWRFRADDELNSSPAYADGTLYIGSNGGSLYALDARTGKQRWRSRSFSSLRWGHEYFYATPTVAYGRVFAGNSDGIVYAFGVRTGRLLWARRTGTYVYSAPAVWRHTVYVGSYDGKLYALDAATGDVKWAHSSPSAVHGAPTVLDGLVYFSSCENCGARVSRYAKRGARGTFALDARTGKLVWSFGDGRYSPVVADSERLYLVGNTWVYGLAPRVRHRAPAS
jgi:outer membrane protein assembly factor BamB